MNSLPKLSAVLRGVNKKNDGLKLSIKVFSGITFQPILPVVRYFLLDQGVNAEFEIGDYDQVHSEIGADAKQSVSYDYIYFHTSIIKYFSRTLVDVEGEGPRLAVQLDEYLDQIERIARSYPKSKLVINLLEYPPFRARGTLSRLDGGIAAVHDVNQKIINLKESYSNILIHDLNYVSAKFGLSNFFDFKFWAAYKQPFASDALVPLGASIASVIFGSLGLGKKLLITDLDNTLWGGVVGDDGVQGIKSGMDTAAGELYTFFQGYLCDLRSSGIPIAICSKNETENVLPAFSDNKVLLSYDDFSAAEIGWDSKANGIRNISEKLNLNIRDMVFVDDNPVEISVVETHLPDCTSVGFNRYVLDAVSSLDDLGLFEIQSLSAEDLRRADYYSENRKRDELRELFIDGDEFLRGLQMRAAPQFDSKEDIPRFAALVNKTNQFNIAQVKITEETIEHYADSHEKFLLTSNLKDKFGDNGIVSVMFGSIKARSLHIDNWVMSCRVFGREFEFFLLDVLRDFAKRGGIEYVFSDVIFTQRNQYCREVFSEYGFECVGQVEKASSSWRLNVSGLKRESNENRKGRHIKADK